MTTDQVATVPKPKGRPIGYKPTKQTEPKEPPLITEEGDYLVIRISKKAAMKLLLKDLL